MHQFLSTIPFDLYELALFQLVVKHRSFTKAAQAAGLTQSAITRQVQGMEKNLGVPLLERTTRTVQLTPAGEFLHAEAGRLLAATEHTLDDFNRQFVGGRQELRVAISKSIGLACLPGFFHANLRRAPDVGLRVASLKSSEIMAGLEGSELDIGVFCPPERWPSSLQITHRFVDGFALIVPMALAPRLESLRKKAARTAWLKAQPWLQIEETTVTGQRLSSWMKNSGWNIEPAMQLDSFDVIINLVALGLGVAFVPIRALALYHRKGAIHRVPLPHRFHRELVVAVRKTRAIPGHVQQFIENVLF